MAFLLSYSFAKVDSLKRACSVFHDFAVTPATPASTTTPMIIFFGVMLTETVATAVSNKTTAIITTPARGMVRISPTQATAMAKAQSALRVPGIREASAAASTGAVV